MRKLGVSLAAGLLIAGSQAALSQDNAVPSPEDYVCALTGSCQEEEATTPAEPATTEPDGPRVSATRGFSLSRPSPPSSTPKATARTQNRQTASRPTQRQTRPAEPGRVDLRLAFELGSDKMSAGDAERVRVFAEALRRPQLANVRVRIEGHTDSIGGRVFNLDLSRRRAQAVADFLVAQGIAATRLEVRGYGFDRPLPGRPASSGDNRRVEAVRIS